jgi:hypothetical protein
MAETLNLGLPLLAPSQAQKHVTVNEALARLDGMTQLVIASASQSAPPAAASEGAVYAVPSGATGDWSGHEGQLAIGSNGGWVFVTPQVGWRGFLAETGAHVVWDGAGWIENAVAVTPGRAHALIESVEFDHVIGAGTSSTTSFIIPQYAMVLAVTGRVKTAITGTLTSWELGVPGSTNRYGSGLSLVQGSWVIGMSGQPQAYYSDTPLLLTAAGGEFAGGELRLAVHMFRATPPEL